MYTSRSQLARVATESWVVSNGYCLACDSDRILQTPTNTHARDFECELCGHPYELKSSCSRFGGKVVDGAYSSMIRRIEDGTVPTVLLLRYSESSEVTDLIAIHRSLITREVIEERPPLALSARRAGWIGCNILLKSIPPEGRIPLIKESIATSKERSRTMFAATDKLFQRSLAARGWVGALLNCLHRIGPAEFTLRDAYSFESELSSKFPKNQNVRPKIRQQLQVLRDAGLVSFLGNGHYRLNF